MSSKARLNLIEKQIELFKEMIKTYNLRKSNLNYVFKPVEINGNTSFNDYDIIKGTKKETTIFEVAAELEKLNVLIEGCEQEIRYLKEERQHIKKLINLIVNICEDTMPLKEKVEKLKPYLTLSEIALKLNHSYGYIKQISAKIS